MIASVKRVINEIVPKPLLKWYGKLKRLIRKFGRHFDLNIGLHMSIIAPIRYQLSIQNSNKYLICRPDGGLNDMLCRIELCFRYALKYKRKLIIEHNFGDFQDNIEKYFILPKYMLNEPISDIQYPVSVYPPELKYDLYNYESVYVPHGRKLIDGGFIHFDFSKNYKEQYLVYHNAGGGQHSISFLRRIKLEEKLRHHIASTIDKLGNYVAAHIRNVNNPKEFQTDYKPFLSSIHSNLTHDTIVVCTDSYEVQQYSKQLFGDKLILPISIPDNMDGKALHFKKNLDPECNYKANVEAITDLFILACSDKLYITNVTCESRNITKESMFYSGFSRLAMNLHKRKRLVRRLLSK